MEYKDFLNYICNEYYKIKDYEERKQIILNMFNDLNLFEKLEKDKKQCISLKFSDEKPTVFNSKIGGVPYLPLNMEYPLSQKDNKPLRFLAQINFEELPPLEELPKTGILQFFLKNDENLGCNFNLDGKDDIKIIYHKNIIKDENNLYKAIPDYSLEEYEEDDDFYDFYDEEYFPVFIDYERKLLPSLENSYHSRAMIKHNEDIRKYIEEKSIDFICYDDIISEWYHFMSPKAIAQIGGYGYSIQGEVCELEEDFLLFQSNSDYYYEKDREKCINWGYDRGIAHFFINKENLKNLDFSSIIYSWEQS